MPSSTRVSSSTLNVTTRRQPGAIGGYREGLTIAELDASWPNAAVRDARPLAPPPPPRAGGEGAKWPLVVFSHGSGAFRASYVYGDRAGTAPRARAARAVGCRG